MPEEELDDLFRKSASEFRPEYDPAAWQAMEEKLDAYRPYPGFWQRFAWLSSLLLIMGLGFGVSLLLQKRQEPGSQVPNSQSSAPAPALPAPGAATIPFRLQPPAPAAGTRMPREHISQPQQAMTQQAGTPEKPQQALEHDKPQQARQQALSQQDKPQQALPKQDKQQQALRHNRQYQNRQQPAVRQAPPPVTGPGRQALQRPASAGQRRFLPASPGPQSPQGQTLAATPGRQQQTLAEAPRPQLAAPAQPLPDTAGFGQTMPAPVKGQGASAPNLPAKVPGLDTLARALPPQQAASAADSSAGEKIKIPLRSRFALRLLAAPDLSAVGLRKPEGVGSSAGLELRFQLRPRWFLTAGLLKVNKKYGARPQDYGNDDYWYNRHLPDDISAVCEVLDLPLQIGYQVVSREKSAFTLHTGLSSYWMLSEDYHYYYTTGTPYTRTWSVRRENRHLFRIYNLSALYTRRLSPALEAGIEPFVKLPLAGVGAGKIKLSSTGVYLSLGYRLR